MVEPHSTLKDEAHVHSESNSIIKRLQGNYNEYEASNTPNLDLNYPDNGIQNYDPVNYDVVNNNPNMNSNAISLP